MKKIIGIVILSILNPFNLFLLTLFVGKDGWAGLARENYSIDSSPVDYSMIVGTFGGAAIIFFITMLLINAFFRKLYEVDSLLLCYVSSTLCTGILLFFLLFIFT